MAILSMRVSFAKIRIGSTVLDKFAAGAYSIYCVFRFANDSDVPGPFVTHSLEGGNKSRQSMDPAPAAAQRFSLPKLSHR